MPAARRSTPFDPADPVLLVDDNHDTLKYLSQAPRCARISRPRRRSIWPRRCRSRPRPTSTCIVSDIELPDGSGLELMWTLRSQPHIPAIALSGFGAPADIEQSRSAGFAIHLTKPVDFRQLEQAIQATGGGETGRVEKPWSAILMSVSSEPNQRSPFFVADGNCRACAGAFLATRRARDADRRSAFTMMMAGESAWALFEALELVVRRSRDQETLLRAQGDRQRDDDSGLCWRLCCSTRVAIVGQSRRAFIVICAAAVLLLAAAWTNPWHHLYWTRLWNAEIDGHWIAMPVYGPLFTAHFIYCYILVGDLDLACWPSAVHRSAGVYRSQAAVMLFGVLFPWVVNIIDMSRLFGFIYVDSAAMSFGVTGLAFVPGLFRYRLLDLTPVAWAAVVEGIDDPVVVIDPRGRIVESEPGRPAADRPSNGRCHWADRRRRPSRLARPGQSTWRDRKRRPRPLRARRARYRSRVLF